MNLISCNFNCRYQREGYCFLSDASASKHHGNSSCIYFDPPEDEKENISIFNSSDDSEPL